MPVLPTLVYASGTLTASGTISADETVVIGGVTYTFKASVTTTANQVDLGASDEEALANLKAAINLESGAGTKYGSATVANPHVVATASDATTLTVKSKVPGAIGNFIPTTETGTNLAWGAATLAGGSGSLSAALDAIRGAGQVNALTEQLLLNIDTDSEAN